MYLRHALAATAALILLAGCSGNPAAPVTPSGSGLPELRSFKDSTGISTGTLGLFRIQVDSATLAARVTPIATRSAQDNDDLYQLAINSFLGSDTLKVTDINADVDSLALTYEIRHPFDAPSNLAGPATAANRADLGVSGMVCLLVDVPTASGYTYFDNGPADVVIAHPWAVTNPDGFYRPRGLFDAGALISVANTFPYKLIVDESLDTRTDRTGTPISNGGNPQGNFDGVNAGWQQGNIGAARNGWTGYGVLHQGQVATNTFDVSYSYLNSEDLDLTAAVVVKYNDPRQGANAAARKANRLPASPADVNKFAYRMPHGALDVERIEFVGEGGGFGANQASSSELRFRVVDWDARASVGLDPLNSDAAVDTIVAGTEGAPIVEVCIPGVLGNASAFAAVAVEDDDSAVGGDAGEDSGEPGDAIYYAASVPKPGGLGESPGFYSGLARATDPAPADTIPLDESLIPLTGELPEPVSYQSFDVEVVNNTWVRTGTGASNIAVAAVAVDSTGAVYACGNYGGNADFGGGPLPSTGGQDMFLVRFDSDGSFAWMRTVGTALSDYAVDVTVSPGDDIWIAGMYSGSINFGAGPLVSAGATDVCMARYAPDSTLVLATRYGGTGDDQVNSIAVTDDDMHVITVGNFTGTINTGGNTHVSNGAFDCYVRSGLTSNNLLFWSRAWGGAAIDDTQGVAVSATDVFASGYFEGTTNFGLGNRTSAGSKDAFLVKMNPANGTTLWDRTAGGLLGEEGIEVATDSNGNVYFSGLFNSTSIDFGGGPISRVGGMDGFVAAFSSANGHLWSLGHGGAGAGVLPLALAVTPSDSVVVGGQYNGSVNFGGGLRPSGGPNAGYFVRIDEDGSYLSDGQFTTAAGSVVNGAVVDQSSASIILGGQYAGVTDFNPGAANSGHDAGTGTDGYLVKLSALGTL